MQDFDVDHKHQHLSLTKSLEGANAAEGGKGDLKSIVSLGNKKREKKGPDAGKYKVSGTRLVMMTFSRQAKLNALAYMPMLCRISIVPVLAPIRNVQ